jgi:peptidoglycan/LPS O-acetylase OafA/YrhL
VACLVVLIGHVIQVINYHDSLLNPYLSAADTIVTAAFNAQGAVLLFFVLSGCVLSLSLKHLTDFDPRLILSFYVKRVFRLYPLLWFATGLAMISMVVTKHVVETGVFAAWLTRNLTTSFTTSHTLMSLTGAYTRYNGPMWSLRVELIYSALFPAIYLVVRNRHLRIWVLGFLAAFALLPIPSQLGTAFALSFAAGALIPLLPVRATRLNGGIAVIALLVLLYDRLILTQFGAPERVFDVVETAAAFFVVRDVFASGRGYRLLMFRPTAWLGELSFSIYLLHLPILLIVFTAVQSLIGLQPLLNNPVASQLVLAALTVAITVVLSAFTFNFVELPLHNIGRHLGKKLALGRDAEAEGKKLEPATAARVVPSR